jgi:hypothetical protein
MELLCCYEVKPFLVRINEVWSPLKALEIAL